MAKRKKRAAVRRAKSPKRGKSSKRAKSAPKKAAKQRAAKASPKRPTKAKSKRSAAKKAAPRKAGAPERASQIVSETVIVDVIEEPVPGVVVVTEFEATRMRGPGTGRQPGGSGGTGLPESKEK